MNSTVNKWQVLHFFLLSIMYTSIYFCSIQQVLNANGLKYTFTDLQPPIKKNTQEQNSKAARLFQDLDWTTLSWTWEALPKHVDWLETHCIQVIHISLWCNKMYPSCRLWPGPFGGQSYLWESHGNWPQATCGQIPLITLFALAIVCPWVSLDPFLLYIPDFATPQVSLSFSALSILHMENGSLRLRNFPKEHEAGLETGRHRLCLVLHRDSL